MMKFFSFFIIIAMFFGGCNSQSPKTQNDYTVKKPSWILNPNQGGKTGAIGIAGITYDQKESTKRKLAITRALDELTLQKGVKVQLNMDKRDIVNNDNVSMKMDTKSNYKANSTVTAHIEDVWENPLTGELYIWMVLD